MDERISPLYDKKITCICCGENFKTKKVRTSRTIVKSKDTDFCVHYEGINPYYYEINVCPYCGYAFTNNFSPLKFTKREEIKNQYLNKIGEMQLCGERSLADAVLCFKLALLCAELNEESNLCLAGLCMRIAWLYRYKGNKKEEDKFLARALSCYQEAYHKESFEKVKMGKDRLFYILGELNGRLGRYLETRNWFSLLFVERNIEPALNILARNQWLEYKTALAKLEA